ncbi:MAG TPA: membrane-bound PQQ-dependent dehydrogenase, glucose/quinate/shikimate family [Micropepsaceae bacterium]|nr:membrane-bound PQQ-dependent dehydrogenase, glucose/quinate/shikimate family [Micropepsaceae bacterium]
MTYRTLFSAKHLTIGEWLTAAFAVVLLLLGIVILAGGVWLIVLGGSWYYAFAGLGLAVSGAGILLGSLWGVGIYLLTYALTWLWALGEVGNDGWALVPRVVAPTLLAILSLMIIPVLARRRRFLSPTYDEVIAGRTPPETVRPSARPRPERVAVIAILIVAGAVVAGLALIGRGTAQERATTAAVPNRIATANYGFNDAVASTDWTSYGGTSHALRYSSLNQINRDNVGKLKRVWTYRTGDMPDKNAQGKYSPETTPLKVDDRLFLCSAKNIIISLDAATGKEWWRYDPKVPDDAIPYGATCRGVAYYKDPDASPDQICASRIIEGTLDARLLAVDAETGQLCSDFGRNGAVDLTEGIGETVPGWYGNVAAPILVRNVIVMGAQVQDGQAENAPSGVIRGYDAVTGKLAWAWDMGHPERTGAPPPGETYTRGTPNMWTSAAGDDALGYVYVPLGNSSVDYYGGNRKDYENEYSSSLVAIDVTTGKPVWHFQTVHYDVWDYDLGSQPTLVDVPTANGPVPAVILPSKQGEIFVLDRRTGRSLFPVEERKVPVGGVEAGRLSRTQPYSGYHSVAKPVLTEKDMWGMSPLDQLWCRIQFRQVSYQGRYTPPTADKNYLQYPGYNGGTDWGSAAVDPKRGILIVNYNNMPNNDRLLPRKDADRLGLEPINVAHEQMRPGVVEYGPQAGAPYADKINPGWQQRTGMMCTRPPYGGITAIDLATGKTLWDTPLGEARANGPFGVPSMLPVTIGTPNNGGPLITAGGLIFIAAATDNLIRAIDIQTGKVVWKDTLPAGGQATPMAYEENGREYIGFMAGGHHFMHTPIGDYVLAYALPHTG